MIQKILTFIKLILGVVTSIFCLAVANNSGSLIAFPIAILILGTLFSFIFNHNLFNTIKNIFAKLLIILFVVSIIAKLYDWGIQGILEFIAVVFIILIIYFCVSNGNNHSGRMNYNEILNNISETERKKYIQIKINELERERSRLITHNTIFADIIGDRLKASEIKRNQKRYDELSKQIEDLQNQLK